VRVIVAYLREAVTAFCGGVRNGGRNIYESENEVVVGGWTWKAYMLYDLERLVKDIDGCQVYCCSYKEDE
jgi:hypothetical protein